MRSILLVVGALLIATGAVAEVQSPLDTLAESTEKSPQALVELGDLYVEAMRLPDAKKAYRKALGRDAGYPEAKFGMARIQIAGGTFKKANTPAAPSPTPTKSKVSATSVQGGSGFPTTARHGQSKSSKRQSTRGILPVAKPEWVKCFEGKANTKRPSPLTTRLWKPARAILPTSALALPSN